MAAVVAFMDDLMFLSRIREAAKAAGVEVRSARTVDQLKAAAAGSALVFVDLDSARLPTDLGLAALKADSALASLPVVGFFGHVHVDRARAAQEAGVGRVLPRSAFVQALPALVAEAGSRG
jgi:DNA-binding NtrC family response regulator